MVQPNLPLGFDRSTTYATAELSIAPGDRLYLLSDGLYEVPDPSGELWGQGRLEATIRALGGRSLETVIADAIAGAARWLGHDQFPDDVALMGVEVTE